jgi:ATP-dependent protease ClpP protease subunit
MSGRHLIILLAIAFIGAMISSIARGSSSSSMEIPEDTVIFREDFTEESVGEFIKHISLAKGPIINVYIDSPGGSVFALDRMISAAWALQRKGKKLRCFIDFAASAAFGMVQSICNERIVQPHSVLMQHQASYGVSGEVNRIQEINRFIMTMLNRLNRIEAKRLRMPLEEFNRRVTDDWYIHGEDAVKARAADRLALLTCPANLFNIAKVKEITVFVFKIKITESGCPLIPPTWELIRPDNSSSPTPKASGRERFEQYREFYKSGGRT